MQHSFNVEIAKEYGLLEAILLNNIWFWIEKNRANEVNYYDGDYWTYNSMKAFEELFPYATLKQIRNALDKLIDNGILKTGNYNKVAYDRTLWYALTEKGKCICPGGQMELPYRANGIAPEGKPIPYINTYINTDNNNIYRGHFKKPTLEDVKNYCQERQNNIDCEHFIDYYNANGWKVGKNAMKDWKATIRNWERKKYNERDKKFDETELSKFDR